MMPLLAWSWLFSLPGLVLTAAGVPPRREHAGYASLPGPIVLLIVSVLALLGGGQYAVEIPNWLPFLPDGAFRTLADPLSALLLAILGFVAALVYIYSLCYMADDPSKRRFFVYLDLFVASMAILVLAGNLAVLLIGWTGVGISSFLLIAFWRDRPGTLGAGLQALAANAIGDGALLLAAGVYLLARTNALLALAPTTSTAITIIAVATALGASAASLTQSNFKKGIAYSTVAQLGYMFAAVGVGAPFAGLFHLFTHASFKALLFLAAGVVIHGASGRESLLDLRGLGRFFPYSRWGFLIGSLALIGAPLITAGSYSKDAIIDAALERQPMVGWLLLGGVLLTGLYIGRLFSIVYLAPAVDPHAVHHEPASERPMNWALVPLMVGAVAFGWLGSSLAAGLSGPLAAVEYVAGPLSLTVQGGAAFVLGALGFVASWWYVTQRPISAAAPTRADDSYRAAGWVRVIAEGGYAISRALSIAQSGVLPRYAFGSFVALAAIVVLRVVVR